MQSRANFCPISDPSENREVPDVRVQEAEDSHWLGVGGQLQADAAHREEADLDERGQQRPRRFSGRHRYLRRPCRRLLTSALRSHKRQCAKNNLHITLVHEWTSES